MPETGHIIYILIDIGYYMKPEYSVFPKNVPLPGNTIQVVYLVCREKGPVSKMKQEIVVVGRGISPVCPCPPALPKNIGHTHFMQLRIVMFF